MATKWSLTQSDENDHDHSSKNGNKNRSLSANLHPTKNGLAANGNACSTNSLFENSSRRLMHRPSAILNAIRMPLVSI